MNRVLLADDQALVRAGFAALLDAEDDIEVIAQAADGNEAFRLAQSARPDVVLMDIRMPGADGLEATRRIAADDGLADVHVVILTTFELDEYVFEALRAGASGFLVKDTEPAELIRAVRVVASGEGLLSPGVTRRLIAEFATRSRDTSAAPDARLLTLLTEREKEVVTLVGAGLSNEDITQRLYLSPNTAKTHTSRAMIKLGARDRAQLVVFAYESGLVRPGWYSCHTSTAPGVLKYLPHGDDSGSPTKEDWSHDQYSTRLRHASCEHRNSRWWPGRWGRYARPGGRLGWTRSGHERDFR